MAGERTNKHWNLSQETALNMARKTSPIGYHSHEVFLLAKVHAGAFDLCRPPIPNLRMGQPHLHEEGGVILGVQEALQVGKRRPHLPESTASLRTYMRTKCPGLGSVWKAPRRYAPAWYRLSFF